MARTAEEYYAERNGRKTAIQSTADNELITPIWACILMKEFAESYHKEKLREELILFCKDKLTYKEEWLEKLIDDYLNSR